MTFRGWEYYSAPPQSALSTPPHCSAAETANLSHGVPKTNKMSGICRYDAVMINYVIPDYISIMRICIDIQMTTCRCQFATIDTECCPSPP